MNKNNGTEASKHDTQLSEYLTGPCSTDREKANFIHLLLVLAGDRRNKGRLVQMIAQYGELYGYVWLLPIIEAIRLSEGEGLAKYEDNGHESSH